VTMAQPEWSVSVIDADATHDLRRRVLGRSAADVVWPGDDEPHTVHLGVVDGDVVVAISTWLAAPFAATSTPALQLRGMATDPAHVGRGLGKLLLDAGVELARSRGVSMVWANARVPAVSFYVAAGFQVVGTEFTTPDTGLPHRLVRFDL